MRIAVVTWSRRKVGGTEAYLESIIPELLNAGHEVAFWHEVDEPALNSQITLPPGIPTWCVAELGAQTALTALSEWRPDVIYDHSLLEPALEAEMPKIAPVVFFAHAYYGTCISGGKTFKTPVTTPCDRRFGWQCLLNYYPHRCGGLNPLTMLTEYKRQSDRLHLLSRYRAIVTHSNHMRAEYLKHGFDPDDVYNLSYYAKQTGGTFDLNAGEGLLNDSTTLLEAPAELSVDEETEIRKPLYWRLLFLGRMDFLKGGHVFIEALPSVSAALEQPLEITFAGDGPQRKAWERQAASVQKRNPGVRITFTGWVSGSKREALWNDCDLLVVPSVWPEPFGLVGPEAGLHGVPIAAFAVGGITDWLTSGVNGYLADGDPPTSGGLAEAIIKCCCDTEIHSHLRRGAEAMAHRFNIKNHLTGLLHVFEKVLEPTRTSEVKSGFQIA